MDAVEFALPWACCVCYFCNPFDEEIMGQVLVNIEKSFLAFPREILIVYYNPKHGYLLDETPCFRRAGSCGPVDIWRTTAERWSGSSGKVQGLAGS